MRIFSVPSEEATSTILTSLSVLAHLSQSVYFNLKCFTLYPYDFNTMRCLSKKSHNQMHR